MLKKRITARVDKVLKTGSLEEEQAKELQTLETLFPENPVPEPEDIKKEQETDEDENSEAASK